MFKRNTLFIVGAGASAEVGMPVGTKLAQQIVKLLDFKSCMPDGPNQGDGDLRFLGQFHRKYGAGVDAYRHAGWVIRDGVRLANSIDDFLDRHSGNNIVVEIGKAAIVQSILAAETDSKLFFNPYSYQETFDKIENTWFMKFFRILGRDLNLENAREIFDRTSFIIFNYDRCLEHFLINALALAYNFPIDDAASIVADLHIVHPYGTVGDLPQLPHDIPVPYGPLRDQSFDYIALAQRIKTYTEQLGAGDVLAQIHDRMFWADQFVFLGFGYHEQNMLMLKPGKKLNLKPVLGTALGMSQSDIDAVKHQLASIFAGGLQGIIPAMQIGDRSGAALFDYFAKTLPS